jgi:hypothetical protein
MIYNYAIVNQSNKTLFLYNICTVYILKKVINK